MKKFCILLTVLSLIIVPALYSQWSNDPNTNLLISDLNGEQVLPKISLTPDGGCYIAWFDTRTGNYNVYLQRLDAAGNKIFASDGLLISDHTSNSYISGDWDMMTDNEGNAILTFSDIRTGGDLKVYAYLISPGGNFLWGADGISLSTANDEQISPQITQTTDGNYIIVWITFSTPSKLAVQKLDVAGNKLHGNDCNQFAFIIHFFKNKTTFTSRCSTHIQYQYREITEVILSVLKVRLDRFRV